MRALGPLALVDALEVKPPSIPSFVALPSGCIAWNISELSINTYAGIILIGFRKGASRQLRIAVTDWKAKHCGFPRPRLPH